MLINRGWSSNEKKKSFDSDRTIITDKGYLSNRNDIKIIDHKYIKRCN